MAQSIRKFLVVFGLCLMLLTCFLFGACSNVNAFKDGPKDDDIVVGNGSLAVSKGDYLYFANGFTSYTDVKDSNNEGNITYSGLYRIKMDSQGNPESVDKTYDEDGNEVFDGSRALKNIDILASKVVGFEYMGLYIFGNDIYYATPNNGVDKNLQTETQYISFFKRKIDRSGKAELVYTTKAEGSKVKFSMLQIGNDVYLTVLDDQTLVVIKNGKDKREIEKVTGATFATYSTSTEVVTDFNKDIYYTRALDSEKDSQTNGNVLCKFNLISMSAQDVFADNDSTLTLKMVGKNKLFYEKTKQSLGSSSAKLYSMEGTLNGNLVQEQQMTANSYSNYYVLPDQERKVLVNDGSQIVIIENGTPTTVYSGSTTVMGVNGNYVYFTTSDGKIMRVNYINGGEAETIVSEKTFVSQPNYLCITDNHLYYISTNQTNDSKYLHEVDLNADELTDYFVGVLRPEDYDTQSE